MAEKKEEDKTITEIKSHTLEEKNHHKVLHLYGSERERERERERKRERERERERETERQTDRETETQRETETERQRQRDRQRLRTENSELYHTRIKILGSCLFLQSVAGNLHANRLHIKN